MRGRKKVAVAALVAFATMSGCTTYQGSRKTARVGLIMTGASLAGALLGLAMLERTIPDGAASFTCGGSEACAVSATVAIASILVVPIGASITVGGLIGMAGYDKDGQAPRSPVSPPLPQPPDQVVDRFWCQRDSGICTNDPGTCGPNCLSATSIWCAPYKSLSGEQGALCGLSSDACFVLTISDHNRRGRESVGECAERTEPLPAAPIPPPR